MIKNRKFGFFLGIWVFRCIIGVNGIVVYLVNNIKYKI